MTITNQIISFKLSGISYSGTSTQLNYTAGVTVGACVASKALVVDAFRNINNINTITATTLTATTLNGTLATGFQPNITSIGTLTNLNISNNLTLSQHNGSTIGLILGSTLVTATGTQLNYNDITAVGTAQALKALILDSGSNITGINNLSATTLSSTNLVLKGTSITTTGAQLNYNNITTPGVAQASRSLVLNSSSNISGINNLSATTLTATTLNGTLATGPQTGITSVGTLTSLALSGDITGVIDINISGTLTGSNITGTYLAGTIVTPAQPNITSLGNISNLNVTGQITTNTVSATNISIGGTDITSVLSNLGSLNGITPGLASASKALILDASRNIGNINSLTSISLVATGTITGSLATPVQSAITSVGNLTTLAIAGSITSVTNIAMTGSLSGANSISATTFNGKIATAYQPNITSLGTLSSLAVSGITSIGASTQSVTQTTQLEINNATGSCLRLSYNAPSGSATNYTDLTLNSSGALTINSSNDLINLQSRVVIGKNSTANILCFNGVTGDASTDMTIIAERLYSGNDKSELLLFKGNDPAGASGPDRIRMRSGEIRFQIYTAVEDYSTLADNNDALIISSSGKLGINCASPTQQLEINNSTGNCLRLIYNDNDGSPVYYSDVNINSSGAMNIKSSNNIVQIGDSSDTAQTLIVGSASSSATTGIFRYITTSAGNYIQSGINSTAGSAADLIISNYGQAISTSTRKIIFNAAGRVGFGTSIPARQLEINEASGNCLRLSYNASTGSATTYCDQNISSTGVVTFTAAGSAPSFTFTGGNITGTLATASQPNITSVGTLTSLILSGAISGVTNLTLSGTLTGATSISATSLVGLLTTAAQGSITSVGTLTSLNISGIVNMGSSTSGTDLLNISSNTAAFTGLRIENRNATAISSGTKISFNGFSLSNTNYEVARIASITTDSGVSSSYQFGSLAFYTRGNNISTNADERMRILSTGNVGIGTTTPSYLLDINGTSRTKQLLVGTSTDNASSRLISALDSTIANGVTEYITLGKAASLNNQAEIGYSHTSDGSTSNAITFGLYGVGERMRIASSGKMGLGTTTPAALFDMGATATDQSLFLFNNGTNIFGFGANSALLKYQVGVSGGHAWYTGSTSTSTGTQLMSLDSGGNLAVTGNISCTLSTGGFGGLKYNVTGIGNATVQTYAGTGDAGIGTSSAHPFGLITNGSYRMYISSAGNIGIGTLSPAYGLDVSSTIRTNNYMYVSDTGAFGRYVGNWSASNYWAIGPHDGSTGSTYRVRIGIASATGVWNGEYPAIFSGAYTNASDYRIKENVTNLNYGLNEIKKIRPVLYNIKNDLNNKQIGFLAHEMQEIIPEVVSGDKDAVDENGNEVHQGINYANLTSVIIKGMQEHIDITNNLEYQIQLLNIENTQIKQQMAEMQKSLELLLQKK